MLGVLVGFFVSLGFIGFGSFLIPLILALISVFVISGAGIVLNDFFDSEIDKINAPQRPIPSGKISKAQALNFSILLFAFGLLLAFFINIYAFALALLNTVLEIFYARNFKAMPLIGNLVDSWFPATTFVFGALIVLSFEKVLWLAILAFLVNMGREIIGDIEDIEGDKKLNAKTLPILFGESKAKILASVFIIAGVALSFVPFMLGLLGFYYLIIVIFADLVFLYSLTRTPSENQGLTKIGMFIALIAFIAGLF